MSRNAYLDHMMYRLRVFRRNASGLLKGLAFAVGAFWLLTLAIRVAGLGWTLLAMFVVMFFVVFSQE